MDRAALRAGDGPLVGGAAPGNGIVRRAPRRLVRQRLRRADDVAPSCAAAGRAARHDRPVRGRRGGARQRRRDRPARAGDAASGGAGLPAHRAAARGEARRPPRLFRGAWVRVHRRLAVRAAAEPAAMSSAPLRYIGDISREDAQLLSRYAAGARRMLEFGAGASTQVLAQSAPEGAEIVTVETDSGWIGRTRRNLQLLGVTREVKFVPYRGFWRALRGPFDFIFDDGIDRRRREFAEHAWPLLAVGGARL